MPFVNLPSSYIQGLEKLITIDDASFNAAISALTNADLSLSSKKFEQAISTACPEVDFDTVKKLVLLARSLISMKLVHHTDSDQIVADLTGFVGSAEEFEIYSADQKAQLKTRLTVLLAVEGGFKMSARATDVLTEHQNYYLGARILTDMRPIFAENTENLPAGIVLTHSLKLSYHSGARREEIFITLDNSDLERLKKIINRAEDKSKTLKQFIEDTPVPYLEPEQETDDE